MTNAEMFQDVFGRFPYLPCEDGYYIDAKLQDRQWWDMPFRRDSSMSVLIEGMEMPKNCEIIIRIDEKGEVYVYDQYPTKLYKAIPVPPHGRLIDADELIAKQEEDAEIFMGSTNYGDKVRYDEAMNAVANIVNAPTVIPADKGGEKNG